jgi:hypothetical protein
VSWQPLRNGTASRRTRAHPAGERAALRDPEARYYLARQLAHLGRHDEAVAELGVAARQGFSCSTTIVHVPWLRAVASEPGVLEVIKQAEERRRAAIRTTTRDPSSRVSPSAAAPLRRCYACGGCGDSGGHRLHRRRRPSAGYWK